MSDKTAIGDRQKLYEGMETERRLMPLLPAMARLDGRCFSSFTKGLNRPFDVRLSNMMIDLTKFLVAETNACAGYTQSDEISLCWYSARSDSQIFFDGRIQKMVSTLAATATLRFGRMLLEFRLGDQSCVYADKNPTFDCRVWNVPTLEEAANVYLWREQDATRNSVQMAARCYYSDKECFQKNGGELQGMLFQKGINWNNYPDFFKRGSWVQRSTVRRKFTVDEIGQLPERHEARTNPDLEVERTQYCAIDMPPFGKVTNRVGVIFRGEKPAVGQ